MAALAPPPFDEALDTDAPMIAPNFDDAVDVDAPLLPPAFDDALDTDAPTVPATPTPNGALVAATGGGNDDATAPTPTSNAVGDFFKRIGAGAASGAMDTLAGGVKFMQDSEVPGAALAKVIGSVTGTDPLTAAKTYAQDESGRYATDYGVDKARDNQLQSEIAGAIGTLIPTLASGPAAPITAAAMMGESGRKEAEAKGGSAGQQEVAFYGNAAVGALTEKLLGLPALLKSAAAKKIPAVGLRNIVSSALKQAGLSAAREGTQEGLEQLSGNIIASEIAAYDPNRPIMQGVGTAALVGGIIGAPLGGVVQIASDIDAQTAKLATELDAAILPEGGGIADTSWRGGVVPPPLPVAAEPGVTATEFDANFIAGYDEEMAAARAKQAAAQGTSEAAPTEAVPPPVPPKNSEQGAAPSVQGGRSALFEQAKAEQAAASSAVEPEAGKPAGAPESPVPVAPAVPARDATKPEQMTPEEFGITEPEPTRYAPSSVTKRFGPLGLESPSATPEAVAKWKAEQKDYRDSQKRSKQQREKSTAYYDAVNDAIAAGRPIGAEAMKRRFHYDDDIPAGYVKRGDLYVFEPKAEEPTVAESATVAEPVIDDAMAKAAQDSARSIAEQVTKGQPTAVREAAETAALDNALGSLRAGKSPNIAFMRKSAQEAAGKAAAKQSESLDAPIGKSETTVGETVASTEPTPAEAAADDDFAAKVRAVVDSLPEDQRRTAQSFMDGKSVTEIAAEEGISKQAVSQRLKAMGATMKRAGIGSEGPGAGSVDEDLATYALGKLSARMAKDTKLESEIREGIEEGGGYTPEPMSEPDAEADRLLAANAGVDGWAASAIKDASLPEGVRASIGMKRVRQLSEQARQLKAEGKTAEAQAVLDSAIDLSNSMAEVGREWGRGINMFKTWAALGPDGILRSYVRAVEKAGAATRKKRKKELGDITEAAKEGDAKLTPEQRADKLRKRLLAAKNPVAKKLKKDTWGKIVELADAGLLTEEAVWNAVAKDLGLPAYNADFARKVYEATEAAQAEPEGFQRNRAIAAVLARINQELGYTGAELYVSYRYANMLVGLGTQGTNAIGGFSRTLAETVVRQLRLTLQGRGAEGRRQWKILAQGLKKGIPEAAHVWKTGDRIFGADDAHMRAGMLENTQFGRKGGVSLRTMPLHLDKVLTYLLESKAAKPLNALKYVGRGMTAMDAVNFAGAKEIGMHSQLMDIHRATGLTGKALLERVGDDLTKTDLWESAMEQAAKEGLSGNEQKFRAIEITEQTLPEEVRAEGQRTGREWTFREEPRGIIGLGSKTIDQLEHLGGDTGKVVKSVVAPFTRTIANVANDWLNYSPYGYKRAMLGYTWNGKQDALTDSQRADIAIKATLGTAAMGSMMGLVAAGLADIAGGGPDDPEKRRQWLENGNKPYSVRFKTDDGWTPWVSYTPTPMGLGMSIIGNYHDWTKFGKGSKEDGLERVGYAVAMSPAVVFDQTFFTGISRIMDTLRRGGTQGVSAYKNLLAGEARTNVPFSSLGKDIENLFVGAAAPGKENVFRRGVDKSTIGGAMADAIPFAVPLGARPALNRWGEPAPINRNRFVSRPTSDPMSKVLDAKNVFVPGLDLDVMVLPRTGKPRPMTPDEKYTYAQRVGKALRKKLDGEGAAKLSGYDKKKLQDLVSDTAEQVRKDARKTIAR